MDSLSDKHKLVVMTYLAMEEPDQAEAWMQVYKTCKSKDNAKSNASKLFARPDVDEYVTQKKQERMSRVQEELQIDSDYVLKKLISALELDVAEILDNVGNVKAINEWPKPWRQFVAGVDLHEMVTGDVETIVRKIKWPDKIKIIELIGKHVDVQAFSERKEIRGHLTTGKAEDLTDDELAAIAAGSS